MSKKVRFNNNLNGQLNHEQKEALKNIENNDINLIIGKPGSGKTFLACYAALKALYDGVVREIIITRPMVGVADKKMGFLPGTYQEKLDPFLMGIKHNFYQIADKSEIDRSMEYQIKVIPIDLMRSVTFVDSYIIGDEIQNAEQEQIYTLLTRLGKNSKMILTGDKSQTDIKKSDFQRLFELTDIKGFKIIELYENHRHPIIEQIIERWNK